MTSKTYGNTCAYSQTGWISNADSCIFHTRIRPESLSTHRAPTKIWPDCMNFRVDVFFICTCISVSSTLRTALTLECYLTVVSCPRHLRWNTTKTDYSDTYSHIRPVLEELYKLCLMRSSCYHFNRSDICDSRDLNFLYAWRMTIVISWVRIYQKAFIHWQYIN